MPGDERDDLEAGATVTAGASRELDDTAFAATAPTGDPVSHHALAAGAMVGRYRVERRVGAGGMGVVYLAHDPALDRPVAVKLVHPGLGSARARLLREGQVIAKLSHPNVVTVHDVGPHDDELFIAMEYVDGETLRAWLARARRPVREVLEVFRTAGRGLAAAHAAGLVHRDFKPDNVLLGRGGRVVVTDFGLARREDDATPEPDAGAPSGNERLTHTGGFVGTPAFASPEQIRGGVVDARSDQFSFCVALWEALHGSRPFKRAASTTSAELLASIDAGVIAPAPDDRTPRWIDRVLRRGLAVDPSARWPDMQALLDALAPPSHRRLWIAGALAAMIAAVAIALMLLGRGSATAPAAVCDDGAAEAIWTPAARDAYRARAGSAATQDVPWFDRVAADWRDARARLCHADPPLAPDLAARRRACLDDALVAFRAAIERADTSRWPTLPAIARCDGDGRNDPPAMTSLAGRIRQSDVYALSPDGKRVLLATGDGKIYERTIDTGDEHPIAAAEGSVAAQYWNDRTHLLVVTTAGALDLVDPTGATPRIHVLSGALSMDASPDGKRIVYSDGNRIFLRATDGGDPGPPIAEAKIAAQAAAWSLDGRWIAMLLHDVMDQPFLRMYDVARGAVIGDVPIRLASMGMTMAWLPDGTLGINGGNGPPESEGIWLLRFDERGQVVLPPELRISSLPRQQFDLLGAGAGRTLVRRTDLGRMLLHFAPGATEGTQLAGQVGDWEPVASDDHGRLLVQRNNEVAWLTLADQTIAHVVADGAVKTPTLRDGKMIWLRAAGADDFALVEDDRTIATVHLPDLAAPPTLRCAAGALHRCVIAARRDAGGALVVIDGDTVGPERAIDTRDWWSVDLSPDGKRLAVATSNATDVDVYRVDTLAHSILSPPSGCFPITVRWARDAPDAIAYAECGGPKHIYRLGAHAPIELAHFDDAVRSLVVAADGSFYAAILRFDMTLFVAEGL